ncbi:MAG: hypothetical protein CL940_02655 [Deltaproteobacteria bacterium]|nr:hypothetical protein [Deltaproteobacteria bacterium]
MEMNAQSSGSCSGSMEFTADQGLTDQSASGAASGACYTSGSCIYACYTTTECCGSETWTQESYTCSQTCESACGNGECESGEDGDTCPEDCAAYCGNEQCEYGEVCINQQCDGDPDCGPCPGDCCPVCGDGICEWPEDGNMVPDQACPEDCSGAACQPVCESFKYCGSDGCGSTCPCAGGQTCGENDQCIPGTGTGSDTSDSCFNSLDCADDKPPTHCIDGKCEPCPPKCQAEPCDAGDCAGCGQCEDGLACKDNGVCGATQN